MSISKSRQSYEDCYDLMDNALSANVGVRVGFDTHGMAKYFRMRLNYARTLDQRFSMERYHASDPRKGKSEYDVLSIRLRHTEGRYWVYVEKRKKPEVIEEIKESADNIGPPRAVRRY